MAAHHIFADTGLADVDAEPEQFTVNPLCTPTRIFAAHPAEQVANLAGNDRSSRLASPVFSRSRNRRKPARCQATTVSGLTIASAERQSLQICDRATHIRRGPWGRPRAFFAQRRRMPIWCRSVRFSSCRAAGERKIEERVASGLERNVHRSIIPLRSDISRFSRVTDDQGLERKATRVYPVLR